MKIKHNNDLLTLCEIQSYVLLVSVMMQDVPVWTWLLLQGNMRQHSSAWSASKRFHWNDWGLCYIVSVPLHSWSLNENLYFFLTYTVYYRNLYNNGIRGIHNHAFNGTKIDKLYSINSYFIIFFLEFLLRQWEMCSLVLYCVLSRVLKNNRNLEMIHKDAFQGATGPEVL